MKNIEHLHQVEFVKWAGLQRVDIRGLPFYIDCINHEGPTTLKDFLFAVPNGGNRNAKEAARLKREGVKAGVSDLVLAIPRFGFHGLFLELKQPPAIKGGKAVLIPANQKEFGKRMSSVGYAVAYCWGWNELRLAVEAYFNCEPELLKMFAVPKYQGRK